MNCDWNTADTETARTRIVVAGLGLLTPLGHAAWETFTALLAGRTLADRIERLPAHADGIDLVRSLGAVSVAQHVASDPSIELAERAAREAMFDSNIAPGHVPAFLGTSKGAVQAMSDAATLMSGKDTASRASHQRRLAQLAPAVALGAHGHLSQQFQQRVGTPVQSHVVAACASSLTALHAARQHLLHTATLPDHPSSDYALVATADAALLPTFIHSYRRLGVLAPLTTTHYRQQPLDAQRRGFMLSETGAAVLLKRVPAGEAVQIGEIELLDTAIAAETHDLIRPSPTMPALRAVAHRLFAGREIDVLHPHSPGTVEHDAVELGVYADVLDELGETRGRRPRVYACKGALGHCLGAAGLTAFVLACMTLRTGRRPAMPWLTQPMEEASGFELDAAGGLCSRTGTHAVMAAGFAGHVAGAMVRRR